MESVSVDVSSAVDQFWSARPEAIFPQEILVAVTSLSHAYFERGRWAGYGPRFIKLGRSVRYRKSDVLSWMAERPSGVSTTEIATQAS